MKKFKKDVLTKKIVSLALLAALAATAAGCGKKDEKVEDVKELSYWVALTRNIATKVKSFNEVLMYQEMEKKTGIHIDFIHPSFGQAGEQFNLLVASGDLPDMIEYDWRYYQGGTQQAIDDEIIIALNDYIDDYAPNFKKAITDGDELSPIYDKASKTDEGQYFGFPNFNVGSVRIFGGPMIRKDWLDELGLDVPTTIDDWTTMLTAFKEKKSADAPFSATANYFKEANSINGAFGVGHRLYLEGDKVKFGPIEKGYKEYIKLMKQWYENGLVDKDFFSNERNMVDSKMTKGNSGATFNTLGAGMGVYLNQMKKTDPNYDLIAAPYPVLKEGDINEFVVGEQDVQGAILAITTSCKNPEVAVKWADYLYSDEGYMLVNFGVENDTYNMVDGKPVYTDKILRNPDGLSVSEALAMNCRATDSAPGFRQAPEYLNQYYELPQQIESYKLWSKNTDCVRKRMLPVGLNPTADEAEECSTLTNDINVFVEEMTLKFIRGEESLDKYDDFVEKLKKEFNVEKYIKIQQDMYNRYNKR